MSVGFCFEMFVPYVGELFHRFVLFLDEGNHLGGRRQIVAVEIVRDDFGELATLVIRSPDVLKSEPTGMIDRIKQHGGIGVTQGMHFHHAAVHTFPIIETPGETPL